MLIIPALEYERLRQDESQWNKIILHREGKFYRSYEWSLWLIKTLVCTEDLQRERHAWHDEPFRHLQTQAGTF